MNEAERLEVWPWCYISAHRAVNAFVRGRDPAGIKMLQTQMLFGKREQANNLPEDSSALLETRRGSDRVNGPWRRPGATVVRPQPRAKAQSHRSRQGMA
jgi:hypothetical protein